MGLLDIFLSMLYFFLFFIWIWLLISIFSDIFRRDMSGWAKAGWVLVLIALPILGSLIYLIVNGGKMQQRAISDAEAYQKAQKDYIRSVASPSSTADQLATLSSLHDAGKLTDAEFAAQKAKLLA